MAAISPTIPPYQECGGIRCWTWPCSCWMNRTSTTFTVSNFQVGTSFKPFPKLNKAQAVWERTDRLKRAPLPTPHAPRVKAPPPKVAWPAKMQRFRCRAKSTRPVQQVVGRGSR